MLHRKLKVLFIAEQCNPKQYSVPLLGYHFYRELLEKAEVTLCTHERNRESLEKIHPNARIVYIQESQICKKYFQLISYITNRKGAINWPLRHVLAYPIYAAFNRKVYHAFKNEVCRGEYDIVHAFTPVIPRYPYSIVHACQKTPFILGPVNGGLPFPTGFEEISRKEFSRYNVLKWLCRLLPSYKKSYQNADKILVGSTYTLNVLKNLFTSNSQNMELFYENGVHPHFFTSEAAVQAKSQRSTVELLFVGRLVPYKCADLLIEAINRLPAALQNKIHLTLVGDGPEKQALEQLAPCRTDFTGLISNEETIPYYHRADIFCFPSLREFGGAVVMEAMASGLPCIVIDNGGIAEYITDNSGFKIKPQSRTNIIEEIKNRLELLIENRPLRQKMSLNALQEAQAFAWGNKMNALIKIYENCIY